MSSINGPRVGARWITEIRRLVEAGLSGGDAGSVERIRASLDSVAVHAECPDPRDFYDPDDLRQYRRHLLWGDEDSPYSILLIKWPPDHVTPIHDHGGVWGIELVIDGALQVDEFTAADLAGTPTRLTPLRSLILGVCDSTAFSDPRYVHRCRNLSSRRPSLSLHVYGGMLAEFASFRETRPGRYLPERQQASLDDSVTMPAI